MKFFFLISLAAIVSSCDQFPNKTERMANIKTCIINHETFNDSLQYKIVETKCPNKWRRELVVFMNNKQENKLILQHIPIKTLHIEGYHSLKKTFYDRTNHQTFEIKEITEHYNDFALTKVDTIYNKIILDSTGNILTFTPQFSSQNIL
jgi:hypothetical protein